MKARKICQGKIQEDIDEAIDEDQRESLRNLEMGGFNIKRKCDSKIWNSRENLYESKITPLLRFFHIKDIGPSGWLRINRKKGNFKRLKTKRGNNSRLNPLLDSTSYSRFEYITNWENCEPISRTDIAPLRIASYDIECASESASASIT